MYGWNDSGGYGGGWMVVGMFVVFVLPFAVFAVLAFASMNHGSRQLGNGSATGRPAALRILDDRLARGEIGTEEYQTLSRAITESHSQSV